MTWTTERFYELIAAYAAPEDGLDAKERKARRILVAATDNFLRLGFRKTSISDVARDAGVGKGTVYLYFDTKADLLLHCVLLEKAAPSTAVMQEMSAITDPAELLRFVVRASFDLVHDMPLVSRLTSGDHELNLVMDELGVEVAELVRSGQVAQITALLSPLATVDEATVDRVARTVITMLRGGPSIVSEIGDLGLSRADHATVMADILVPGILHAIGAAE